jgi:hypothetical protein
MEERMNRYRVRKAGQSYATKGPDLLRTKPNARGTLRALLGRPSSVGWYIRKHEGDTKTAWHGPMNKSEVLEAFDAWKGTLEEFIVGRKVAGEEFAEGRFFVRYEDVPLRKLDNCSAATSNLHSLVHYQYPKVVHSGDYLFRQMSGSDWWSDHAWGTALDESPRDGMTNDQLFDWCVRMFRSGNASADYILGSLKGRVMEASAPDWSISPSDASNSHTWHNHISVVDHDGDKPPRQGGVF